MPSSSENADPPPPDRRPSSRAGASVNAMAVGRFIVGTTQIPSLPAVPGFTIRRFIARGGTAQVWEAVADSGGPPVAIKIAFDDDPEVCERLLLEADTLRSLRHPNIVGMLDEAVTATADRYSSWSWWMAPIWRPGCLLKDLASRKHSKFSSRSSTPSVMPTPRVSSTATSNRSISASPRTARRRSPISVSPVR